MVEKIERGEMIGPEVLKTDEQFIGHEKYSMYRTIGEEKCNVNINELIPNSNVPQDLGAQVQNLLQANSVTTTEFRNQYQQIQQMQQIQQLQQTQQIQQVQQMQQTQGMEFGM